jgi:PhnB protein
MQIEAYLVFNGNCEEALNFYAQALGGKATALMRFEGSPMEKEVPPG